MSLLSLPSLDELRSAVGNQVIIVTGAAQGIIVGFAIAQTLGIAGAQVILADLDTARGEQALSEIGHGALFVTCDVTSWTDHCRLFQTAMAHFGRIDTVICNAGVNPELTWGVRADFFTDQPLYCASKHAALGLVRAVAQHPECAASGIAISMVSP